MNYLVNGLPQSMMVPDLHHVPVHRNSFPANHPTPGDRLSPEDWRDIVRLHDYSHLRSLPLHILGRTSFERLCRVRASEITMMNPTVERLFEQSPLHRLIAKIQNSIWRTSFHIAAWNEIVDAWNGLKSFSTGMDGMTAFIDHTTGCNSCGYGEYVQEYIDGCLAFRFHYQSRLVMTVGFSFASKYRILIEQVQLTEPSGNRWLFRLPAGRLEYVIKRMAAAFPRHKFLLVDGMDLAQRSLANYKNSLSNIMKQLDKPHNSDSDYFKSRKDSIEARINHITQDMPRIAAFYDDVGSYSLSPPVSICAMKHRKIIDNQHQKSR